MIPVSMSVGGFFLNRGAMTTLSVGTYLSNIGSIRYGTVKMVDNRHLVLGVYVLYIRVGLILI